MDGSLILAVFLGVGMISPPTSLFLVEPCRWFDTREFTCVPGSRPGGQPCPVGPFKDGEIRQYLVQAGAVCQNGSRPIPLGARSVVLKFTTFGGKRGRLTAYDATALEVPLITSVSLHPIIACGFGIVQLGQLQGQEPGIPILPDLAIYVKSGGADVHVVVDVIGYFMPYEG